MRVALSFPGCHRRGGVERVVLECANFLQQRGHETHVIASHWDDASLRPGVHREPLPGRRWPGWLSMPIFSWQSRRRLRALRPHTDVLGSFGVQSPPGGVMWIQSVHKAWIEISRRRRMLAARLKQRLNPFHPVALAFERYQFAGRRYRKLVALTDQVKADLQRFYDVPSQDVVVIPNGFSPAEFNVERATQKRDEMRGRLGYDPDDHVIIFVANELERKGFGPLLRAAAALGPARLKLLVVGRVTPLGYADEIRRLGMQNRILFAGPTSDVADYYAAADSFALPTQYEAWGLVIVEAMACGLPVLTSRLAGAAVAVRVGETGYLLDEPDDVEEVTAKLCKLVSGGLAGRERIAASVAEYAWERVLPRYEAVLLECADGGRAAAGGVA